MNFDLSSLDGPNQNAVASGKPLQLALHAIDEDPRQPRTEFDAQGLQELADSIAERGVRVPISIRSHPDQPGRWMVNAGARRVRACRMVGRVDIPAFVDETFDSYDQVIENEQREGLKPIELALFIQREMSTGLSQAEGLLLWEMKKTAARDTWGEIEPTLRRILEIVVVRAAP